MLLTINLKLPALKNKLERALKLSQCGLEQKYLKSHCQKLELNKFDQILDVFHFMKVMSMENIF